MIDISSWPEPELRAPFACGEHDTKVVLSRDEKLPLLFSRHLSDAAAQLGDVFPLTPVFCDDDLRSTSLVGVTIARDNLETSIRIVHVKIPHKLRGKREREREMCVGECVVQRRRKIWGMVMTVMVLLGCSQNGDSTNDDGASVRSCQIELGVQESFFYQIMYTF